MTDEQADLCLAASDRWLAARERAWAALWATVSVPRGHGPISVIAAAEASAAADALEMAARVEHAREIVRILGDAASDYHRRLAA